MTTDSRLKHKCHHFDCKVFQKLNRNMKPFIYFSPV